MKAKKYNYFYKITNLINNHFYYGVHSTDNLEDGYMGSGKRLQYAYKKYGIEKFKKEILKYFDTQEEAYNYEELIVNENLIKNDECYNIKVGGTGGTKGYLFVKTSRNNEFFYILKEDYNPKIHQTSWTGKHHTLEGKNNRRKKQTPKDSTNPRVWVTNMKGTVKYIRKEQLDDFLKNGFELGRTGYVPRKNAQGKIITIE